MEKVPDFFVGGIVFGVLMAIGICSVTMEFTIETLPVTLLYRSNCLFRWNSNTFTVVPTAASTREQKKGSSFDSFLSQIKQISLLVVAMLPS